MIIDQPVTFCLSPQQFHALAIRLGVDVHAHQDPCDAVLEAIGNLSSQRRGRPPMLSGRQLRSQNTSTKWPA